MTKPLSRETIAAMPTDEYTARRDEIHRWAAAGAPEGEPAPPGPHERPDGHRFTRAEIRDMDPEDVLLNRPAILAQVADHGPLPDGEA